MLKYYLTTKDQQTCEKTCIIQKKQTEVKRKGFRGDNELTETLGVKEYCIHEIITGVRNTHRTDDELFGITNTMAEMKKISVEYLDYKLRTLRN